MCQGLNSRTLLFSPSLKAFAIPCATSCFHLGLGEFSEVILVEAVVVEKKFNVLELEVEVELEDPTGDKREGLKCPKRPWRRRSISDDGR